MDGGNGIFTQCSIALLQRRTHKSFIEKQMHLRSIMMNEVNHIWVPKYCRVENPKYTKHEIKDHRKLGKSTKDLRACLEVLVGETSCSCPRDPENSPPLSGLVALFDQACSFGRDTHGALGGEVDIQHTSQVS